MESKETSHLPSPATVKDDEGIKTSVSPSLQDPPWKHTEEMPKHSLASVSRIDKT